MASLKCENNEPQNTQHMNVTEIYNTKEAQITKNGWLMNDVKNS